MRPLLLTTAARVYTGLVSLAAGVVVGRRLGPAPRGAYEVLADVRLVLQTFAVLSIANTYFVVRERALLPRVVGSSLALGLGAGAVVGGALAFAKVADPSWLASSVPGTVAFFAAAPAIVASALLAGALLGAGRLRAWNGAIVVNRTVVLAGLAALLFVPGASSLDTLLWAVLVAEWLALGVAVLAFRGDGPLRPRVDLPLVRRMARYGLVASVHNVLGTGLLHADVFVVERLRGSADAGQYGVAILARDIVLFIPWIASLLVLPRVAGDAGDRGRHARALGAPSLLTAALLGAALWATAPTLLVALHREEFLPAVRLARILVPAGFLLGLCQLLFQDLLGRGAPRAVLWIPGLGLALLLGADLAFVPRHGPEAAAWACLGVAVLVSALTAAAFLRHARR